MLLLALACVESGPYYTQAGGLPFGELCLKSFKLVDRWLSSRPLCLYDKFGPMNSCVIGTDRTNLGTLNSKYLSTFLSPLPCSKTLKNFNADCLCRLRTLRTYHIDQKALGSNYFL